MSVESPSFEASFVGEYGIHHFPVSNGLTATTVTGENWQDFILDFASLRDSKHGNIILSPQLMASAEPFDEEIGEDIIAARVALVREISSELSQDTTVILGSRTFYEDGYPADSQILIKNGVVTNWGNKLGRALFDIPFRKDGKELKPGRINTEYIPLRLGSTVLSIIGSDLVLHSGSPASKQKALRRGGYKAPDPITQDTKVLLVSSIWAAPTLGSDTFEEKEAKYLDKMFMYIEKVFCNNPSILDILVADRGWPENDANMIPYTAHFKRSE